MAPSTLITFKGKLVWTGLILFGAVWMFVLGIMVGRGTAPIPKVLPHFENEIEEGKIAGETESTDSGLKQDLVYPEELKNPTPYKPVKPVERKTTTAEKPKPKVDESQKAASVQANEATQRAASKPVEPKQATPAEPLKKPEKEPIKPSNQAKGQYTVQIAALKSVQSAEKLVQELRSKGFEAYQIRSQSENNTVWYRVRVGAYRNRSDAEKALSGLNQKNVKGLVLQVP